MGILRNVVKRLSRGGSGVGSSCRGVLLLKILLLSSLATPSSLFAQQADEILGRWDHRFDSVVVEFIAGQAEGGEQVQLVDDGPVFHGVIVRDDWHPWRVDRVMYQSIQYQGKGRWVAQEVDDKGKVRKVRLRLKRDGFLHTTSFLDGRKKIQWSPPSTRLN